MNQEFWENFAWVHWSTVFWKQKILGPCQVNSKMMLIGLENHQRITGGGGLLSHISLNRETVFHTSWTLGRQTVRNLTLCNFTPNDSRIQDVAPLIPSSPEDRIQYIQGPHLWSKLVMRNPCVLWPGTSMVHKWNWPTSLIHWRNCLTFLICWIFYFIRTFPTSSCCQLLPKQLTNTKKNNPITANHCSASS